MKTKLLKTALLCAFVLTLNSCSTDTDEPNAAAKPELVVDYSYTELELQTAKLINDYRVSKGLNPLELINYVSVKSEEHNEYMIEHQVVNHDQFNERAQDIMQNVGAMKVNENIAYNYQQPIGAVTAWLNSPGHKANIEGSFTHFGISVTVDQTSGKKYYTNIFIKK
ncbi:CAP domain-containing protein [Flavobacterium selenitireducens]|uniref:CAP domain-containing protein n=1 Tax=Flavobacterium selenitireducens TaxID=2722704 RepID=UPI00168B0178|nr:CAP domain-containing protein [Flavobacterium selenitireducens]MBD3581171.1 CAP domain-containing protein [Flavobacterium selenitireducens]